MDSAAVHQSDERESEEQLVPDEWCMHDLHKLVLASVARYQSSWLSFNASAMDQSKIAKDDN